MPAINKVKRPFATNARFTKHFFVLEAEFNASLEDSRAIAGACDFSEAPALTGGG